MAKFGLKTKKREEIEELPWHAFEDEGDGEPVEFQVNDLTVSVQHHIDRLVRDREYHKSLALKWDDRLSLPSDDPNYGRGVWMCGDREMPEGSGDQKAQLRSILMADHVIKNWRNIVGDDGKTPLPCDIVNKTWAMERPDLGLWLLMRAQEGGGKVVKAEVKNFRG